MMQHIKEITIGTNMIKNNDVSETEFALHLINLLLDAGFTHDEAEADVKVILAHHIKDFKVFNKLQGLNLKHEVWNRLILNGMSCGAVVVFCNANQKNNNIEFQSSSPPRFYEENMKLKEEISMLSNKINKLRSDAMQVGLGVEFFLRHLSKNNNSPVKQLLHNNPINNFARFFSGRELETTNKPRLYGSDKCDELIFNSPNTSKDEDERFRMYWKMFITEFDGDKLVDMSCVKP